jgi:anti-sigma-K factor RskA
VRFFGRRDLHSLAGAYALDALDGAELKRFERHLRHCEACDSEVRRLAQTATALAMATAAEPPAGLRERVLAAVAVTSQLPPVTAPDPRRLNPRAAPWSSRWYPRLATAVAVVAVAVAAVLGGLQVATQHQLDSVQAHSQQITAVLTAPDARIASAPTTNGATATVVVSRAERKIIFVSSGLPELPAAKAYELWLLGPAGARPAGLLPPPSGGKTAPVLASGLETGDKVGVTVEPSGGTSAPTTTPILVMTLPD